VVTRNDQVRGRTPNLASYLWLPGGSFDEDSITAVRRKEGWMDGFVELKVAITWFER
jgi:hypothetical protein